MNHIADINEKGVKRSKMFYNFAYTIKINYIRIFVDSR